MAASRTLEASHGRHGVTQTCSSKATAEALPVRPIRQKRGLLDSLARQKKRERWPPRARRPPAALARDAHWPGGLGHAFIRRNLPGGVGIKELAMRLSLREDDPPPRLAHHSASRRSPHAEEGREARLGARVVDGVLRKAGPSLRRRVTRPVELAAAAGIRASRTGRRSSNHVSCRRRSTDPAPPPRAPCRGGRPSTGDRRRIRAPHRCDAP